MKLSVRSFVVGVCIFMSATTMAHSGVQGAEAKSLTPAEVINPWNDDLIEIHPDRNPQLYNATFNPPHNGDCPAVVAIVARGSEQNSQIRPTRYSAENRWTSNGFEERVIRVMFRELEASHLKRTGESLMKDVYVMGMTDKQYPAALPLESVGSSAIELPVSVNKGRKNVVAAADSFEQSTGCSPKYLLVGYSQGALVVGNQAQVFIDRDQYVGTFLLGNPAQYPGDPTAAGIEPLSSGLTSSLGLPREKKGRTISYCRKGDVVCDSSPGQYLAAVSTALSGGGGSSHVQYFEGADKSDEEVFETLGGWIEEAR